MTEITIQITDEEMKSLVLGKMESDLNERQRSNVIRDAVEQALSDKADKINDETVKMVEEVLKDPDFRLEFGKEVLKSISR